MIIEENTATLMLHSNLHPLFSAGCIAMTRSIEYGLKIIFKLGVIFMFASTPAYAESCQVFCVSESGKKKIAQKDFPLAFASGDLCKNFAVVEGAKKCKATESVAGSFAGTTLVVRKAGQ